MKATKLLTIVLVLQGLILLGQWTGNAPQQRAYADVTDALNTRGQAVDELKELNRKMDKLLDILSSGNLQVQVASPDENTKEPAQERPINARICAGDRDVWERSRRANESVQQKDAMSKTLKHPCRAFTLIEILAVVFILGLTAAVVLPQMGTRDDLKASAAARMMMADLVYAQNRAITYQANHYVKFDLTHKKYSLTDSAQTVLTHPVNQTPYTMAYGAGGSYGLTDASLSIDSINLVGVSNTQQTTLGFDDLGTPLVYHTDGTIETLTTGTVVVKSTNYKLQITIAPYTGQLSVTNIP